MTFDGYAIEADKTTRDKSGNKHKYLTREYLTISLAGESGEFCNKVKKLLRGDTFTYEDLVKTRNELGDILWYLNQLAINFGLTLDDIAQMNIEKLSKRNLEGKIKGNGDER